LDIIDNCSQYGDTTQLDTHNICLYCSKNFVSTNSNIYCQSSLKTCSNQISSIVLNQLSINQILSKEINIKRGYDNFYLSIFPTDILQELMIATFTSYSYPINRCMIINQLSTNVYTISACTNSFMILGISNGIPVLANDTTSNYQWNILQDNTGRYTFQNIGTGIFLDDFDGSFNCSTQFEIQFN